MRINVTLNRITIIKQFAILVDIDDADVSMWNTKYPIILYECMHMPNLVGVELLIKYCKYKIVVVYLYFTLHNVYGQ